MDQIKDKPKSSSNIYVTLVGLLTMYAVLAYSALFDPQFIEVTYIEFTFFPFIFSMPIVLIEVFILKCYRNPSSGLNFDKPKDYNFERSLTKFAGLLLTVGICSFFYWVFPEYEKDMYQEFFRFGKTIGPYMLFFAFFYIFEIDAVMDDPKDAYWQMGRIALLDFKEADSETLFAHMRTWLIKIFFFPMMLQFLYGDLIGFKERDVYSYNNFYQYVDYFILILYISDLTPVIFSYAFNLRFLDNHIRSADRTLFGWFICIMCYPPFWSVLFYQSYFSYANGPIWSHWFRDYPTLSYFWGSALVFVLCIYSLATVAFGLRWSNLTYRGLMTDGPFRITKHPAYIFKNISWWLLSVPFIANSFGEAVQHCFMLICINLIYYYRAVTEERHLSKYPEYVEYGLWMNENGIFRFLNKRFPIFVYTPDKYKLDPH